MIGASIPADLPTFLRGELAESGVAADATVVIACSGGSDSVALAHAVYTGGATAVVLAHVEHGIRSAGEREAECSVVDRLGATLTIPVARRVIPADSLREEAVRENRSLEELARRTRYRCLEEIAREHRNENGESILLTGHHHRDQVETILMRLFTGRSLLEPLVIPGERSVFDSRTVDSRTKVRILRPLLGVRRETLVEYVAAHHLPVCEDSTNDDTRYLRNRVRKELLPALDRVFSGWNPLDRIVERAAEAERLTAAMSALVPERAWGTRDSRHQDRWRIPRPEFYSLPSAAREIVLRRALYRVADSDRVSFQSFRAIVHGSGFVRSGGVVVRRDENDLVVLRDVVHSGGSGYLWRVAESACLRIRWSEGRVDSVATPGEGRTGWLIGPVRQPVIVRPRRRGDTVLRRSGPGSVATILKRSEPAPLVRAYAPVLEDAHGVVTLFGNEGPICTRRGVQCIFGRKTRREGYIFLCVEGEETDIYAEQQ